MRVPAQRRDSRVDMSCLQHRLTDEARRTFEEMGLLTIDNALAPEQVAALTAATDRIYERHLAEGFDARKAFFYPNFIADDDLFAGLVDYATVLPKVWGILGWNIYLYHAHLIVTPPSGAPPDDKTFGWHQDSGRVNVEVESHPRPRLSLKVAYFLSDTSEPGRGNFWVIPGSHLCDTLKLARGPCGPTGRRATRPGEARHGRLRRPAPVAHRQPQLVDRDAQSALLWLRVSLDPHQG